MLLCRPDILLSRRHCPNHATLALGHLRPSYFGTNSRYVTVDLKDFYLGSLLPTSAWIRIPTKHVSDAVLIKHDLHQYVVDGHILFRVDKSMYGHPAAGRLANEDLVALLASDGYIQYANIPCFSSHVASPISFTLVVHDFGVKYTNKAGPHALVATLEKKYEVKTDITGGKYGAVSLDWDYASNTLETSMPNFVSAPIEILALLQCLESMSMSLYSKYGAPDTRTGLQSAPP